MRPNAKINTLAYLTTAVILTIFAAIPVSAGPAAKATSAAGNLEALALDSATDVEAFVLNIHTANQKDLFVDVAMQCGLSTTTTVVTNITEDPTAPGNGKKTTKKADTSSAIAEAGLGVKVTMDGNPSSTYVYPGNYVTFCKRSQTLEAILGQALVCDDMNGDNVITLQDECDLTDQQITMILNTLSAHSFNFIIPDVGPGDHTITIWATYTTDTTVEGGRVATATAMFGLGSVTVEEVRMVKDTVILQDP
jgi:hypothetical protein